MHYFCLMKTLFQQHLSKTIYKTNTNLQIHNNGIETLLNGNELN